MTPAAPSPAVLVLAPHPDDELLGCPAHLFGLRDAGWRVVVLALTLGSATDARPRRRRELEAACSTAGFELVVAPDGLLDGPSSAPFVADLAARVEARVLVSPGPHDDHPRHELTGRVAIACLRDRVAPRLWLWGLWADIALPTSLCVYRADRLAEIEVALEEHGGEIERNDYLRLLRARGHAGAVLLPERVFRRGAPGLAPDEYGEAVCEVGLNSAGEIALCAPVLFDASAYDPSGPASGPGAGWLELPSPRRAAGGQAHPPS